jgi:hypothetical protein
MAYSYVEYTADGLTNQFPFAFPFIEQSHIKVYLDGEATVDFTFANTSTIQLNAVPTAGVVVRIRRETPKGARLVNFTNTAILRESTLDKDANHLFYVMQEVYDSFQELLPVIDTIGSLLEYGAASLGSNTFNGDQTINGSIIGPTLTGVTLEDYSETKANIVATSGTIALDLSQGNVFVVGPTGNVTFQFTNPAPVCSFSLAIDNGDAVAVTWPSNILWPQGAAPTLSEETDILVFFTHDGGTYWYGSLAFDACQ